MIIVIKKKQKKAGLVLSFQRASETYGRRFPYRFRRERDQSYVTKCRSKDDDDSNLFATRESKRERRGGERRRGGETARGNDRDRGKTRKRHGTKGSKGENETIGWGSRRPAANCQTTPAVPQVVRGCRPPSW